MNSLILYGLYNCSATILERNITFLLMLNRSELLNILRNALDSSAEQKVLRDAFLDCFFNYQERPFDLSWWQKLFWSLIFAAMLLVATCGNVIVIWIVLGKCFSTFLVRTISELGEKLINDYTFLIICDRS